MAPGVEIDPEADTPPLDVPEPATDAIPTGDAGLRALFEHAPIGKAVVGLDGSWRRVNPALSQLTGYDACELVGGRFTDITHPDDLEVDRELRAECLAGTRDRYEVDKRYIRSDGRQIWVSVTVSLVRDGEGRPSYFISQIRDITDRVTAKERLEHALAVSQAANAALREADDLKDHLLAVTSHELRTPLTSVLGFAKTLHTRWDDVTEPQRREAVAAIYSQARRLKHMVDDLLLLSAHHARVLRWEPEPVALPAFVGSLNHRHPEVAVAATGGGTVLADIEHVHGIVDRLLDNAVRHGGQPVGIAVTAAADGVVVSVTDGGPGVPSPFIPHLFRIFEQADTRLTRTTEGAGLGLAAVAAIAQVADVPLWYEPNQPVGARFCIRLPIVGEPAA